MSIVNKIVDPLRESFSFFGETDFQHGFCLGLVIGLLILFISWLIYYKRNRCEALEIDDEGGTFSLSAPALKSFLRNVVQKYNKTTLRDVKIKKRSEGIILQLYLQVYADTDVMELREKLREDLLAQAEKSLGIGEQILRVDIKIRKISLKKDKESEKKSEEQENEE